MKLAEELYQGGFISYPRTETDRFDPGYDLQVIFLLLCLNLHRVQVFLVVSSLCEWCSGAKKSFGSAELGSWCKLI